MERLNEAAQEPHRRLKTRTITRGKQVQQQAAQRAHVERRAGAAFRGRIAGSNEPVRRQSDEIPGACPEDALATSRLLQRQRPHLTDGAEEVGAAR
jgi:hypothetical protein